MIIVTSEYIFINPIENEMNNIRDNTIPEDNKKCGDNFFKKIEYK